MKVLVIGSGAREHALGWKLKQSPLLKKLFFAPGNAGTALLGENVRIRPDQISALAEWALSEQIDLTVVGPEAPLISGISELFSQKRLLVIGPSSKGARLEGSKDRAKAFMQKHGIPTAKSVSFDSFGEAAACVKSSSFPLVIKADGLAQGKGVAVCSALPQALEALDSFMVKKTVGDAAEKILVETFLEGEEVSAFALLNGRRFCYLGEARDYKRAYDRDLGPNTGGMGCVSTPFLVSEEVRKEIRESVFRKVLQGLEEEGVSYRGILYAGLILTRDGLKVLEFNVRFGDPEAQVLLPRMDCDLLPPLYAAAKEESIPEELPLKRDSSVGVVIAAEGYPADAGKGNVLPDLEDLSKEILFFHSSTSSRNGVIVNDGGRTLTAVGWDGEVEEARRKVYATLGKTDWTGFFYRKDIGAGYSSAKVIG